jgi:hypothetical protein
MKNQLPLIFFIAAIICLAFSFSLTNKIAFPLRLQKTVVANLKENDSLCYYECLCVAAENGVYLPKDSVKKISFKGGLVTLTTKYSLTKKGSVYRLRKFESTLKDFPNKKFAYLKLVEKPYWNFKLVRDTVLSDSSVLILSALELKLRALTEYNFKVERDNYPQLIINGKKTSEQRMVEGDYILSRILPELR